MGQVLHGCAQTTHAVRPELQRSTASAATLARQFGINPKTVLKWRKRDRVQDSPMGPKEARSTVLTPLEEAAIVAFRKQTLLPLDDVLFALQPQIPNLTRSSLHRLLEHHCVSRLPKADTTRGERKHFKSYPIGFFHIDIAEVRCADGKLFLYVAIDRTSKFAYAELHAEANRMIAAQMLANLIKAVPYRIHTVLRRARSEWCGRSDGCGAWAIPVPEWHAPGARSDRQSLRWPSLPDPNNAPQPDS